MLRFSETESFLKCLAVSILSVLILDVFKFTEVTVLFSCTCRNSDGQ